MFKETHPILGTRDIQRAIAFFTQQLGFKLAFGDTADPPNYVGFRRDACIIVVRCLSCQHRGVIAEGDLVRFGIKPGAPVAQFVKRLRCRKCGSGSVMAQRTTSKSVA
jgi:catechol 2,3-dioxygenase-like lactoylglutathione lyase family enzyme